MKFQLTLVALFLVAHGLAISYSDVAELIFFYTVYDMDAEVFGPGLGYVALGCAGTGGNNRCSYGEFINYLIDGKASKSPFDVTINNGSWTVAPGSLGAVMRASYENLSTLGKEIRAETLERLIQGRKTIAGIWNDLGFAMEKGRVTGATQDIGIKRHLSNIIQTLGAVREFYKADADYRIRTGLKDHLRIKVEEIRERESAYVESHKWQEIEWERVIKNNPDMANPKSELFKEVTYELEQLLKSGEVNEKKTIFNKIGRIASLCIGPDSGL